MFGLSATPKICVHFIISRFKEGGAYCFAHVGCGMLVSHTTKERSTSEASNLVDD